VGWRLRELGSFPLGVNALRSDGRAALAVAVAIGAQFIRVNVLGGAMITDQGLIQGCAAQVLRLRQTLRARVKIWGDLLVKHARPLVPVDPLEAARDLVERAGADALVLTGPRTGTPVDRRILGQLAQTLPRAPRVVGSGTTAVNLEEVWPEADGFLVGSWLKKGSRPEGGVDPARVRELVAARQRLMDSETGDLNRV
jgi:membrane complex biogenesis BtpA family protein